MGFFSVFLLCRSRSHMAPLRTMQPIQAPTLCSSRIIFAHNRPLDRDRHLSIQSTKRVLGERNHNSACQVLHSFLQHRAYACDLYFHPHCVL
ncbi:hypothetical protein BDR03DRAFT_966684 [Suillus americanus]|nr:hypothetical protein BDR03DRAFT_966684 [Suillus americanus]